MNLGLEHAILHGSRTVKPSYSQHAAATKAGHGVKMLRTFTSEWPSSHSEQLLLTLYTRNSGSDLPWCSFHCSCCLQASADIIRNDSTSSSLPSSLNFLQVGSMLLHGPDQSEKISTTACKTDNQASLLSVIPAGDRALLLLLLLEYFLWQIAATKQPCGSAVMVILVGCFSSNYHLCSHQSQA